MKTFKFIQHVAEKCPLEDALHNAREMFRLNEMTAWSVEWNEDKTKITWMGTYDEAGQGTK